MKKTQYNVQKLTKHHYFESAKPKGHTVMPGIKPHGVIQKILTPDGGTHLVLYTKHSNNGAKGCPGIPGHKAKNAKKI